MKHHVILAAVGAGLLGCTAFVAANLSSTSGTVVNTLGGCFALADTTCGECIANSCENPNGSQPVSLAKVCSLDQYASIISSARECSANASINDYNCQDMFIDGGTYASSIDDENAAVNNLQHCITDKCATSCSRCAVQVPTCGSETVDLVEAGSCASCIDRAMNAPGSPCQSWVLNGGCVESSQGAIATCAVPSGSCQGGDCSGLSSPSTDLEDAGYSLYTCLWNNCSSQCPSP